MGNLCLRVPTRDSDPLLARMCELAKLRDRDLSKLYRQFVAIDDDRSGTIDIMEFHRWLRIPKTKLTEGIFNLIDADGSGALDFFEFVAAVVTYCLFDNGDVLRFVFVLFDKQKKGVIAEHDLEDMLKVLHGREVLGKNEMDALSLMDSNGDGVIDWQEFTEMKDKFPRLLAPAFTMQDLLQKNTFGRN